MMPIGTYSITFGKKLFLKILLVIFLDEKLKYLVNIEKSMYYSLFWHTTKHHYWHKFSLTDSLLILLIVLMYSISTFIKIY